EAKARDKISEGYACACLWRIHTSPRRRTTAAARFACGQPRNFGRESAYPFVARLTAAVITRSAIRKLFAHLRPRTDPAPPNERHIIVGSPLFDGDWYLHRNPDVAAAGLDPALHYFMHGAVEGRDPGPRFSTSAYLAMHPDVEAAGMNPLLHYVLHGASEGRRIAPSTAIHTNPAAARKEYETKLISDFESFLSSRNRISIKPSNRARSTVIIVLHNKAHFSYACLKS